MFFFAAAAPAFPSGRTGDVQDGIFPGPDWLQVLGSLKCIKIQYQLEMYVCVYICIYIPMFDDHKKFQSQILGQQNSESAKQKAQRVDLC